MHTSELQQCSAAEITHAYDNSILATDTGSYYFDLAGTEYDTAMVYVSDRGESLGENGLYLHGMP